MSVNASEILMILNTIKMIKEISDGNTDPITVDAVNIVIDKVIDKNIEGTPEEKIIIKEAVKSNLLNNLLKGISDLFANLFKKETQS